MSVMNFPSKLVITSKEFQRYKDYKVPYRFFQDGFRHSLIFLHIQRLFCCIKLKLRKQNL
jgi:hypothetical protein